MADIFKYFIAGLPIVIVCFFVYKTAKSARAEHWPIFLTFLLGGLGTIPLLFWQSWVSTTVFVQNINIWKTFIIAFGVVAVTEELAKSLVVYLYPYRQSFFNKQWDGIIYSATAAMGFASVENFLYAYQNDWFNLFVRAFTAVPLHAALGVIVGYYFGLAKFYTKKKWFYILRGLLIVIGLHGLYDFFIDQKIHENLIGAALLVLGLAVGLAVKLVKKSRKDMKAKVLADAD